MKPRTVAYLVLAVIVLVFLLANWSVITSRTELNFLAGRVVAPLGVLILLIAAAILAVDFVGHALSRRGWANERRVLTQEIDRLRARVDQVEESRVRELHDFIEHETALIRSQLDRVISAMHV